MGQVSDTYWPLKSRKKKTLYMYIATCPFTVQTGYSTLYLVIIFCYWIIFKHHKRIVVEDYGVSVW